MTDESRTDRSARRAVPIAEPPHQAPPRSGEGLDRIAARLYRLAVRTPDITFPHMTAAGIPADAIGPALARLVGRGLIRRSGDGAWQAVAPDPTLPVRDSAPGAFTRNLTQSGPERGHVTPRSHRPEGVASGITVFTDTEALADAVQAVLGSARWDLRCAYADSPGTAHLLSEDLDRHRRKLVGPDGTRLRRRTTLDSATLRHACMADVLRARAEGGEETRFLAGLPFSVIVADDTLAVVDLTSFDTSGAGSLLVEDRRLVLALHDLCETWWRLAAPLARDGAPTPDEDNATILSMLAAGATDATMATHTGLSQRTVERRVRTLMQQLGATTRFQAGVLAMRRDWL